MGHPESAANAPLLPANPLSIELTAAHRRLWWHTDDDDDLPERWTVSADIWGLEACEEADRHVADIDLVIAGLNGEQNLLDSVPLGEWTLEFIAETVIETNGRLHRELERRITPGPPAMVVLRRIVVSEPWRGHGLGAALIGSALRIMRPTARLAACRVSPTDFHSPGQDRIAAEVATLRAGALLERVGFELWHEVHIVDLRSTTLMDAGAELMQSWFPRNQERDDQ